MARPHSAQNHGFIDPTRKQWHRIPTHFRKKRGNGWGTMTVFSCRINSAFLLGLPTKSSNTIHLVT
jgi:hypothetical protein